MARASEPAVTPDDIVFELECFERSDDRLRLTGRWFGVRGRRFVRPTLTVGVGGGRMRSLADLGDKPWAAEDGQPWTASFPWEDDGHVEETELSVAPDIAIQLPAPSSRRTRSERLSAVPRREAMTASWGEWAAAPAEAEPSAIEAPVPDRDAAALAEPEPAQGMSAAAEPEPEPDPEPEATREELETLTAQLAQASDAVAASRVEVESLGSELAAVRAQLVQAHRELERREAASETIGTELADARRAREAALRNAAQAEAERETALTRAAEAEAERESLAADHAQVAGELERVRAELERARAELERLSRERDQAVATRGAALVMRGAAQALPAYEQHVGWVRRGLALLLLFGAVFAALIVLHVL